MTALLAFIIGFAPVSAVHSLLLACAVMLVSKKTCRLNFVMFAFWIVAGVGCWFSWYPEMAFWGFYGRNEGLLTLTVLMLCASFPVKSIGPAILAVTVAPLTCLLIGLPYSPVAMGAIAAISIAVAAVHARKPWEIAWILPGLALLVFSRQRIAIPAAFIGLLAGFWYSRRMKWWMLASGPAIACLCAIYPPFMQKMLNFHVTLEGSRFHWFKEGCWLATMAPPWGYGLDTLSAILTFPERLEYVQAGVLPDRTHFWPLDLYLQVGWLGTSLLAWFVWIKGQQAFRNRSETNAVAVATLVAWSVYGCMNPQGIPSTFIAWLALFSISERTPCVKS